ncbi:metallo-mystery pair system four-Cys motif protein [Chitiniphilus shinanonensis]|uniref:Metallo-mystery pair system four-Cys motif protein n=1 Tax=Chitiniphilus shinanonensis TaxID=553088 RepID=A0ABQ6BS28_9NEIS|nr:MbnP family copper-binding protein [Chitiniphilus shinanonensis]GLS04423.1 metallo-mystery pair system four-Cys motif protein [Chitiniphilus shinanonensis]
MSMQSLALGASLALTTLLTACGGGGDSGPVPTPAPAPAPTPTPTPAPQALAIDFVAKAGTAPVACGSEIAGLGSGNVAAQLQDLRFYVSSVALLDANDVETPVTLSESTWQHDGAALIDLEDGTGACAGGNAAMNSRLVGTVPPGNYTGIKFVVGLPAAQNHSNVATAPAPLDVQAMAWSWTAGRLFTKIELADPQGAAGSWSSHAFFVHLGAGSCTGNPANDETVTCARPNRMDWHSHSFDAATQQIVVDLKTLLATSDITVNGGGSPGCMSNPTDPECPAIFDALKIDLASGLAIDGGHGQKLFRVENK